MIKTIYVCDRCGSDIGQGEEAAVLGHDLCPDCMEDLGRMVDDWMKVKKKVDWGKAQALRDAGWSLEQIGGRDRRHEGDGLQAHEAAEEAEEVRS